MLEIGFSPATLRYSLHTAFPLEPGSLLVGKGFRETNLAIVSAFSDPIGQMKEPMGKNRLARLSSCCSNNPQIRSL